MDWGSVATGVGITLGVILLGWLVERQLGLHVAPRLNARLDARRQRRTTKRLAKDRRFMLNVQALSKNPVGATAFLVQAAERAIVALVLAATTALFASLLGGVGLFLLSRGSAERPYALLALSLAIAFLLGFYATLILHQWQTRELSTYASVLLRLADETENAMTAIDSETNG